MRQVRSCVCGDHAFAPLTKGFVAMVSPEDSHLLRQHWRAHIGKKYVTILSPNGGKFVLSRVITGAKPEEKVDHISGQTMDNRRTNLRLCSHAENMRNRGPIRGRDLPKGVTCHGATYSASICVDGEKIYLGRFPTLEAAASAYRDAAFALHGDFARAE